CVIGRWLRPGWPARLEMKIEEWQHIETLFHAALLLSADERVAYLTRACAGNDSLRAEVDSLLAAFESQNGFLEEPALSLGLRLLSDGTDEPNEEALAGVLLGPFKIMKLLVAGGMGIVYLAEDIRLGRKVALKFLPRPLIDDKWAKRQLMKEAQAAAMLDHPNICTIYGFEEEDKHSFIVMQYVEGETLGSFMRREMLPPDQARSFALQIASALAEAHAHGIIHRDIKPQNIMLTVG